MKRVGSVRRLVCTTDSALLLVMRLNLVHKSIDASAYCTRVGRDGDLWRPLDQDPDWSGGLQIQILQVQPPRRHAHVQSAIGRRYRPIAVLLLLQLV